MASLKEWLNESPYAASVEREQCARVEDNVVPPSTVFDPLTHVTADARFIVRQLTWNLVLWFLVVPLILGFLLWAVSQH